MALDIEEAGYAPKLAGRSRLARELGPMLRLAGPVVVAELGWMAMGIVDTIVVGRLGAEATGSVGLGNNLHIAVAIFGIGLLLGLDAMVSQEHGAGLEDEARRSLTQGIFLALAITPALMFLVLGMIPQLAGWGIRPSVLTLTVPYLRALVWSTGPLLVFAAFRRYLQGVGIVKPITFALVSANLVNLVAAWAFVYGHLGFPRMGVEGSGWATCVARVYMMAVVIAARSCSTGEARCRNSDGRGWNGTGSGGCSPWASRRRCRSRWRSASSRRPRPWLAGSTRRAWPRTTSCSRSRA